jgi:hypothetical protein
MRDKFAYIIVFYIFVFTLIYNLTKMKNAKLVFGLLMLTVFSLSFVLNNSSDNDKEDQQTIERLKIRVPTNG